MNFVLKLLRPSFQYEAPCGVGQEDDSIGENRLDKEFDRDDRMGLGKKFEWKKVRMNQKLCSYCFFFENKETQIF